MRNTLKSREKGRGQQQESTPFLADAASLALVLAALFLLLSLFTYHSLDPTLNVASSGLIQNSGGAFGAYLGGSLVEFFGLGAFAWPLALGFFGLRRLLRCQVLPAIRWVGFILFWLCIMVPASGVWGKEAFSVGQVNGGGFLGGSVLHPPLAAIFPFWAGAVLWLVMTLVGLRLLLGGPWHEVFTGLEEWLSELWQKLVAAWNEWLEQYRARRGEKQAARDEEEFPPLFRNLGTPGETPVSQAEPVRELPSESVPPKTEPPSKPKPTSKSAPQKKQSRPAPQRKGAGETVLPHLELIEDLEQEELRIDKAALVARAQDLQAAMENFNVKGQVRDIHPGPVVTMFEFKPASGVRINKIAGLADDLALALKALAVRIVAPIPGKDTVGIEIPNEQRQMVGFREILDAPSFADAKSVLTMALGKDISGRPRSADLSRMPHLLVAGATGAGKSVCLNAILLSFLFKAGPEQVRLLLVDPKRIELSVYADLPHLVHPVVTDMAEAKTALEWAVYEMDRRYEAMAKLGVRNIEGYNAKLAKLGPEALQEKEEWAELANLPYLVIVIDELADLMFTAAKEAEMSIVRLAQLARAAGIHMILATQRPSVDVVTGLIKANFPCRISFQVTSKFDSRTILDSVGAEYLLGKGDMLFKPSGGKLERMHGAYVRDEDVNQVVDFWRSQQGPDYELDFASWQREGGNGDGGEPGEPGGMDNDPMYTQAVDFVLSQGKGSISLLQRRFRIGFNRAARYIEQMEADGYVGPADGSKPRLVLKGRE